MLDLENLQQYRENNRLEAKEALGGLPESIWETYAAFANTEGGVILLGVEELPDKTLHALDILDPQWLIEDFWRFINDPQTVSKNILKQEDVQIHQVDGKQIIVINIPKAEDWQRPIYIGTDPYQGAYYRCGEGDYRLPKETVAVMQAQRREKLLQNVASYIDLHYADDSICASCDTLAERSLPGRRTAAKGDCASALPCAPMMASRAMSLEDMLKQEDAGFTETLLKLIDKTGKKDSEIYKKANISKQHFSKIRNNPNYRPTKSTAIAFAVALELDMDQTGDLIGRAGYALTNSSKFDLIIRYFVQQKNYNIVEINMALYEFDQPLLGA